jgi:hypothetical protein
MNMKLQARKIKRIRAENVGSECRKPACASGCCLKSAWMACLAVIQPSFAGRKRRSPLDTIIRLRFFKAQGASPEGLAGAHPEQKID